MKIPRVIARQLTLPLLGKELVEQAAQRRTYVLRVIYAATLFIGFALMFSDTVQPRPGLGVEDVLGRGRELFQKVVMLQMAGIFLFLPAMVSAAITAEKEQGSIGLLLLTGLSPTSILWQKYLGRLIPMFTFLLLSLPLMAVAYGFGGISTGYLWSGIVLVVLACLQVGAFALMCSSWCRTSVEALAASYLGGALFYFAPPVMLWLFGTWGGLSGDFWTFGFFLCPAYVFDKWGEYAVAVVIFGGLVLISAILFLALADTILLRRAFAVPRHRILGLFGHLDRLLVRLNERIGGIRFLQGSDSLPGEDPVGWRELQKRPWGKLNHLIRIWMWLESIALLVGVLSLPSSFADSGRASIVVAFGCWATALLVLVLQGANAFAAERSQLTLEPLLATPVPGREIVQQKMRPVLRLWIVLVIPLLSIFALQSWWQWQWQGKIHFRFGPGFYTLVAAGGALNAAASLLLVAWFSFWVGLKSRTKSRAIGTALGVVAGWWLLPVLIQATGLSTKLIALGHVPWCVVSLLFPLQGVYGWGSLPLLHLQSVLRFSLYAILLYLIRRACVRKADVYLRKETSSGE